MDQWGVKKKCYGYELILDIHSCDVSRFNRKKLTEFFIGLCKLIEMERGALHFWDYEGDKESYDAAPDHLKGTSAIQFITTSNITIHALDILKTVHFNLFSCKEFNIQKTVEFTLYFFGGIVVNSLVLRRI